MKMKKLLKKMNLMLSRHEREKEKQRQELQDALQRLKDKQRELEQELAQCHDPARQQELEEKISILTAQRKKGLGNLRNPE